MNDTPSLLKEIGLNICGHKDKKSFNLLYRADTEVKVDEFHSKCDGKGPTVTILYLKNNTIYGGYTSEDWSSDRRKTKADKHAFLFYKNDHVDEKCDFIPIAENMQSKAITCDPNFGPTFGWGTVFTKSYDLQTFKKDSKSESECRDGSLILNGAMNIGCAYKTQSRKVRRDIVTNLPEEKQARGTLVVPEQTHVADPLLIKHIVVYQVVEKPWRKFPTDKELQEMKKRLEDFKPVPGLGIKKYNILLLGAIESGKSSFFNTLATVFAGSVKSHAPARSANAESVTNEIHAYELKSKSGKLLNLQIFDIRGLTEERGYDDELEHILNGRLPVGFTFPEEPAPVKEDKLIHTSLKNEMHLVCFVTGSSGVNDFTVKLRKKINDIKECVNRKGLPMVVVVTKFDEFSETIFEDANQIYRCLEAHDAIKEVSDFFGIQEKYIFPIVNYINDYEIKEGKDRLALHALDEMVRLTNDYIEKHKEKTSIVDSWTERENKLHIPLLQRLKDEKNAVLTNLGKEMTELGDNTLRILCVGTVNSGKSSFVDSILSTIRDEICSKASGGYATGGQSKVGNAVSTTEKFQMYRLRYKQKLEEEDELCSSSVFIGDLPGFQEHWGKQLKAVKYVVQGHVPNSYKIKDGINRDSDKFKKRPEKKDKVNCVCFIFDISTPADELPGKIQDTFRNLQRWLLGKKIPYIVILTKGDLLNAAVGEGKYQVFENNTLKENKDKLIKMFGFKQSKMFPVVNYIHEDTVVPESDVLLIAALKEILKLGKQYFEDSDEKDTDESDNEEKGSEDCETNKTNG